MVNLIKIYKQKNKLINLFPSIILAVAISLILIIIIANLPLLGDPNAPIHLHVVPEYLKESKDFFHIPNVVTNILLSMIDTFPISFLSKELILCRSALIIFILIFLSPFLSIVHEPG